MHTDAQDLYTSISELRTAALHTLGALAGSQLAVASPELSCVVAALQRATNELGRAEALLDRTVRARVPLAV